MSTPMAQVVNGQLQWKHNGKTLHLLQREKYEGKWVTVTLKPVKKPKTLSQMGYYYAAIVPICTMAFNNLGWTITEKCGGKEFERAFTENDTDLHLKNHCARIGEDGSMQRAADSDTRQVHTKGRMTCEQARQFIDSVHAYAEQNLHETIVPRQQKGK